MRQIVWNATEKKRQALSKLAAVQPLAVSADVHHGAAARLPQERELEEVALLSQGRKRAPAACRRQRSGRHRPAADSEPGRPGAAGPQGPDPAQPPEVPEFHWLSRWTRFPRSPPSAAPCPAYDRSRHPQSQSCRSVRAAPISASAAPKTAAPVHLAAGPPASHPLSLRHALPFGRSNHCMRFNTKT